MLILVVLANPWVEWVLLDLVKSDQFTTSLIAPVAVAKDMPLFTVQDIRPLPLLFLTQTVVIHLTPAVE
jgi:hypothetical protein